MAIEEAGPPGALHQEENGPACSRCGGHSWDVERRPKSRLHRLAETLIAAPDVSIFQNESAGWPDRQYGLWTCRSCGHRARV